MVNGKLKQIKKILENDGLILLFHHCLYRLSALIFSLLVFRRIDICIHPDARLAGTRCMKIGRKFHTGRGLWLETVIGDDSRQECLPNLIIGDRVCVGEYVHIGCNHRIVIGDDVLMGSKIYITDHNHGKYHGDNSDSPLTSPIKRRLTGSECVEIGTRCWIGEFVTILPGVSIGEGSIIGSHSTVTHDIPANSIAVGSPARVVKVWSEDKGQWVRI